MTVSFSRGWYAIFPVCEIKEKPISLTRLGISIVLWGDKKGKVVVMEDSCPHRSAKLSLGKVCNNNIVCPFHGFQFSQDGTCIYAPEFNKPIPGLKVKTFKVKVEVGMIWLYYGDNDEEELLIDPIISLHKEFNSYSYTQKNWFSHITRCIENQLDYTHLPYVHHNTIGRNFKIPHNPKFIKNNYGISTYKKDDEEKPLSEYIFPNAWILHVSEKMKLLVYFVPISETETKFYLFTYRKFLIIKPFNFLINSIMNFSNKIILNQDQKVVESQGLLPSYLAKKEVLMRHDTAIRMFRELWQLKL